MTPKRPPHLSLLVWFGLEWRQARCQLSRRDRMIVSGQLVRFGRIHGQEHLKVSPGIHDDVFAPHANRKERVPDLVASWLT